MTLLKITCKKGYNAKNVLQFLTEYIEKMGLNYPMLKDDMEIEISLKDERGNVCPDNDKIICFDKNELDFMADKNRNHEDYYNKDALTGNYNRSKYERDIQIFQLTGYTCLTCVYIDAVGLHEINNHLGHKAGDHMLCSISDGIRKYFPDSVAYRIGGDEFVILCPEQTKSKITEVVYRLKEEVRRLEYEISVGIEESVDSKTLNNTINDAEKAMRYDKMNFYHNNGKARQLRTLNYKLERLLLEKQDASHFLDVIAPKYKGVYIVNAEKDTCRYIYVPPYFQKMLDDNEGAFLYAMKAYCRTLVYPEYHERFETLLDYKYIQKKLKNGQSVEFRYQKLDGNWIKLKITIYDEESLDSKEILWIFSDETKNVF